MSDTIQQKILDLGTHDDPDIRRQAATDLAEVNTSEVIRVLALAIKDDSKGVRDAASRSLMAIGGPEAARAVVGYIKDGSITIRNLAAELLFRFGKDSISAIEPYLHDPDHDVRKMAVDILGLLRHKDASAAIIPLLYDTDPNVVISAVEALGNVGSDIAVTHLIQVFKNEEYTRAVVAESLGKIKGEQATEFLLASFGEQITGEISDPLTLFGIIEALGAIGEPKAFALLGNHLYLVKGKLRRMMLAAMMWIADKSQLPFEIPNASTRDMIDLLEDGDLRVRLNAVRTLAGIPDLEVTKAFVGCLGSSEYFDVILLGILETRDDALDVVLESLETPSFPYKKQLILLLRAIFQRTEEQADLLGVAPIPGSVVTRAFSLIEAQWATAEEETRQSIVETLFVLDGEKTLVMLDTLMNDPDPWLRLRVVELLSTLTDERLPEFVARYITDEDEMVRSTVEWVLDAKGYSLDSHTTV